MASSIANLLRNLGWIDGFRIPVANESNKILEVKVAEKIRQKSETTALHNNLQYTVNEMKQFRNNTHDRRMQNQNILNLYRNQLEAEKRSLTDVQCEKEKFLSDLKGAKNDREKALERKLQLLTEVEKSTEQMNKLQKNIKWCEEIEEFWNKCTSEQAESINIIQMYKLQDNKRFQQLELKRIRLSSEVEKCKVSLDEKLNEKLIFQNEQKRSAKLSKKLKKEKIQLIDRCELAMKILTKRDDDIAKKSQEVDILKEVIRNKDCKLSQQNDFWKEQTRDNMEVQIRLNHIVRDVNRQERENCELVNRLRHFKDELIEMRLNVIKSESELLKERNHLKIILDEIERIKRQKELETKRNSQLKRSLKDAEHQHTSVNIRTRKFEQIYQDQEKLVDKLERDCENKKSRIQDAKNKLDGCIADLENVEADIKYRVNVTRGLDDDLELIRKNIKLENDLLEKLERQIKEVESKIVYAKGGKPDKEKIQLEEELTKLTAELKARQNDYNSTVEQIKRNDTEIRLLNNDAKKNAEKLTQQEQMLDELKLLVENDQKELDRLKECYKEKQLEENILLIKLEKLRENLVKEADEVYDLKKRHIELEAFAKKRKEEIVAAQNVLTTRKRTLLKEHSDMKKNFECLNLHIGQLTKKHDVIIDSMGKDKDGQPISLTNYKIAMVQERAELLEKGDELDSNIKKAEKEIQAMENTRQLLNVVNQNYRQQYTCPDNFNDKRQEIDALEKQLQELLITLKEKKESLKALEFNCQELLESEIQLKSELDKLKDMEREKLEENCRVNQNADQQLRKITKLDQQIRSVIRSKKNWKSKLNPDMIIRDVDIRILQEVNKTALQQLGELSIKHVEMVPVVKRYLAENNILLPAAVYRAKSSTRSLSSSRCSSGLYDASSCQSDAPGTKTNIVNIDFSVLH